MPFGNPKLPAGIQNYGEYMLLMSSMRNYDTFKEVYDFVADNTTLPNRKVFFGVLDQIVRHAIYFFKFYGTTDEIPKVLNYNMDYQNDLIAELIENSDYESESDEDNNIDNDSDPGYLSASSSTENDDDHVGDTDINSDSGYFSDFI